MLFAYKPVHASREYADFPTVTKKHGYETFFPSRNASLNNNYSIPCVNKRKHKKTTLVCGI